MDCVDRRLHRAHSDDARSSRVRVDCFYYSFWIDRSELHRFRAPARVDAWDDLQRSLRADEAQRAAFRRERAREARRAWRRVAGALATTRAVAALLRLASEHAPRRQLGGEGDRPEDAPVARAHGHVHVVEAERAARRQQTPRAVQQRGGRAVVPGRATRARARRDERQ